MHVARSLLGLCWTTLRENEMREGPTIQIEPLRMTIHSGRAMLVTDHEGWIGGGRTGLFHHDTRYLSTYQILLNDLKLKFLTAAQPAYNCAILTYTNPKFQVGRVMVDELALLVTIRRAVDDCLHEAIELTSFAQEPLQLRLQINLECSFEDIFEVRELRPTPPRVVRSGYDDSSRTLSCAYRNGSFHRSFAYQIASADASPRYSPNLLILPVQIGPQQSWRAEIIAQMTGDPIGPLVPSTIKSPSGAVDLPATPNQVRRGFADRLREVHAAVEQWASKLPQIHTPNQIVQRAYDRAIRDLASLRLQKVGDEWFPAAGVPWYNCIFGRDALVTALQCLPMNCPFPRAVLTLLAELQGTRVYSWNDEEPGKILHEYRAGELSLTGKIPFNPYYATVDAPLLYVLLLAETYRFTGDRTLLEQFVEPAERCLRWAEEYGDIDGDGFIEYWMRSPQDYHNQGWKDAGDAVVTPDGRIVPVPIAIVEVQGYYYAALCAAAEISRVLGDSAKADAAEQRAAKLYQDFNHRFWLPDEQFYAYGLDPEKRPIRTIASNPGQLLWTRIVPPDRAALVAKRLVADDLFCGWGVRTLSAGNGAYAPVMYQRGSVWPHDNAIIAWGLKRYGHWREANRIAEGTLAASAFFANGQLPELWGGVDRADTSWPVLYAEANVPQAWAAGSVPMLLRTILGLEPDAERHRLLVQPTLPDWLDELTLHGLRFGDGTVDLKLKGTGTQTEVQVLQVTGPITVEQQTVSA